MQAIISNLATLENELPSDEAIYAMAESFKALADPTRLKILALILPGERSVGNLADHLVVSQSAVSHQLRLFRSLNIVRYRKVGREVYYALADEHVRDIFLRTYEHILHDQGENI